MLLPKSVRYGGSKTANLLVKLAHYEGWLITRGYHLYDNPNLDGAKPNWNYCPINAQLQAINALELN
jgi:hypothetical protein